MSQHIYAWGDYVHFLYTSGIAIWLCSLSAALLTKPAAHQKCAWDCHMFLLGLFFVFVGLVTDLRKHVIEDELFTDEA